jgi:hypothetical protein
MRVTHTFPQMGEMLMSANNSGQGGTRSGFAMLVLTSMVFLGAILLFGMEPLAGRILVPFFGGAAHVWLTSLMFFQAMLLVGYLYAHLFAQRLGRWHLLLLILPLINLPLGVPGRPSPETPLLALLATLLANFALPFGVLSTTAVVAQSWLTRSTVGQRYEPYPLYAASNAGSLLALFGYALLAEPLLGVQAQRSLWSVGYAFYAILVVAAWFSLRPGLGLKVCQPELGLELQTREAPAAKNYAYWLLLSALPSGFLLTVTNFIALEVGSFPLVWITPLALYLCSFVVTFRSKGGVPRFLGVLWPEVVILGFLLYLLPMQWVGWFAAVIAPLLVLLAICLVAHGELYERRPPVRYLTHYYLTMAVGGFLGGVAVSLVAPQVFSGLYEYPILLGALGLTFWWCRRGSQASFWSQRLPILQRARRGAVCVMLGLVGLCLIGQIQGLEAGCKFRHRNFYGTYRVQDYSPSEYAPAGHRRLLHGKTNHGAQLLDPEQRLTPTAYYYRGGAIAEVYDTVAPPRRIAVLGLGAGVMSAYTRPQDVLTYYEIDPDNEKIARDWFTYLNDARARVRVVPGDGRLSLNQASGKTIYDIILVDAFTGDGIPTHLLTREAIQVYLKHLADDGLILLHISNRYYDLRGVVKSTLAQLNLAGAMNIPVSPNRLLPYEIPSQCVVMARNPEKLQPLLERGWVALGAGDGLPACSPWTDDYINILAPLWTKLRPQSAGIHALGPNASRAEAAR